jgi:hypothetical protein
MISQAAMNRAELLCRQERQNFGSVERKCMTYVRIHERVIGALENQAGADELFLMLVRTELEHPVDEDSMQRSQTAWLSARASELRWEDSIIVTKLKFRVLTLPKR